MFAQLHLGSLVGKRSPRTIRTALKNLPTGSEAYDYAYKDAMTRIEGQVKEQEELAKQVLSWASPAKLTMSELQHALAVDPGDSELGEDNLPQIEDVCDSMGFSKRQMDDSAFVHFSRMATADTCLPSYAAGTLVSPRLFQHWPAISVTLKRYLI